MDVTTGQLIGAWITVGLTLGLYSFLYKDNPVYKFCEHVYVGVGTGYMVIYMALQFVWPKLLYPLYRVVKFKLGYALDAPLQEFETLWLFVPLFFCICMGLRFLPKAAWLSRWAFAFFVGYASGTNIPASMSAQLYQQVKPTLAPLWTVHGTWKDTFQPALVLVGVLSTLVYFFFSVEHKGIVHKVSRIGIVFLMIAFGSAFGFTVMARESLLIGRIMELDKYSRGRYEWATWVMLPVLVIVIAILDARRKPGEGRQQSA